MSKLEILGYIIIFKAAGLVGLMAVLLGLGGFFENFQKVYWVFLGLGVFGLLAGLALAAATEKNDGV
jgi:hypothetical protein